MHASDCEPSMENETLSSRIASALRQRGEEELLFAHVNIHHPDSAPSSISGSQRGVVQTALTVRAWRTFVSLLQQRFCTNAPGSEGCSESPKPSSAGCIPRCDVGIYCSDTFHTCLVESACLFLGLSFCPFRPDDPPLRLARLEQRRRPRHKLHLADVAGLLRRAMERSAQCEPSDAKMPPLALIGDACIAYYMHTSGSTGDPKCVVASRGNLRAYLDNFIHCSDGLAVTCDPPCRIFCLSSPFFDPSIGDMLATLCTPRSTFYTCSPESILNRCVGALMAVVQPTHVVSTPAVWRTVTPEAVSLSDSGGSDARDAMKVFLGGERMPQALISAWADRVALFNIYGVTEATIYQSVRRVYAASVATEVTCGPGVGTRIDIDVGGLGEDAEPQDHFSLDTGVGEVVLYGEQVCCGYADEPQPRQSVAGVEGSTGQSPSSSFGYDAVRRAFFFRTGDVGRLVSSGPDPGDLPQLVLRGRRDWQIKLNGQRVSLEEVEEVVQRALEGVCLQCACFCVKSVHAEDAFAGDTSSFPSSSPTIGAAVVLADVPSDQVLEDHRDGVVTALQQILALHLPLFMIPQRWRLLASGSSLPQTATGKVNRAELARITAAADACTARDVRHSSDVSAEGLLLLHTAEHDALYTAVQSAWERHLGVTVHAHTHYVHAGGDSLGALKLSRSLYLDLLDGGEEGIDEHGGLPSPFQPCVLLQHPRLVDYVAALRSELPAFASPARGSGDVGGVDSLTTLDTPIASAATTSTVANNSVHVSPHDALLAEVVATQCCGLVARLLEHALVDVNGGNTRAHRCVTPLHIAVSSSNMGEAAAERMVHVLLRHGAKPTAVTPDGVTPAHLAAAISARLLQVLLTHTPALLHCRDGRQQSLLHFAARSDNVAAVALLRSTFAVPLDTRDKWQRTPVHWAVLNGHVAVLEVMQTHRTCEAGDFVSDTQEAEEDGGSLKRRRRQGGETARFTRLARKKTYLAYETLCALAHRTCPGDAYVMELCRDLSPAVGEVGLTPPGVAGGG